MGKVNKSNVRWQLFIVAVFFNEILEQIVTMVLELQPSAKYASLPRFTCYNHNFRTNNNISKSFSPKESLNEKKHSVNVLNY